jgi:putative transposase
MPHSASLRAGRFSETQRIYLLTATTENREMLFSGFTVGRLVVAELKTVQQEGLAESLAWALMPDHLHWLITLEQGSISDLMRRIKGRSAKQINTLSGRQGKLWRDGFHDRALRREEDVLPAARYIVANPLRAWSTGLAIIHCGIRCGSELRGSRLQPRKVCCVNLTGHNCATAQASSKTRKIAINGVAPCISA